MVNSYVMSLVKQYFLGMIYAGYEASGIAKKILEGVILLGCKYFISMFFWIQQVFLYLKKKSTKCGLGFGLFKKLAWIPIVGWLILSMKAHSNFHHSRMRVLGEYDYLSCYWSTYPKKERRMSVIFNISTSTEQVWQFSYSAKTI